MQKKALTLPALLLAALSISAAQAAPAPALKEVPLAARHQVELTNQGSTTLKVVARNGYDRANEATPSDNGLVELLVAPGRSVVVDGPYNVYEQLPSPTHGTDASYISGG